ncbi:MAG: IS21 family transposase [Gemmatimonadota bacterium]|nr:MAG: IS21 family transposase [Gemmatimonadota bacterium]
MDQSSQLFTRFHALGAADLKGPEGTSLRSVLARPKLLGVLSYLAAASPQGLQRRDTITGLLWGELSQERARGALRQALYHLRQSLAEGAVVTRGDEEVGLDRERFWSDVAAFEEALERGDREEALELYRGDLLQGFFVAGAPEFERWLDGRRLELRERAQVAAWELAQVAEIEENPTEAARWARQARRLAPLDEELLRQVIELLGRLGDRSGAVREYEGFATRLAEELELEPAAETRRLIEAVRSRIEIEAAEGAGAGAGQTAGEPAERTAAATASSDSVTPSEAGADVAVLGRASLLGTRAFRLGLVAGAALATRLFEEIRAAGYSGSYTQVKEYVREVRPRPPQEPVIRFETPAGRQAQVDFAHFRLPWGRRCALLVVLSYSRYLWVRFYRRQDMGTLFAGLEDAFRFFGGVPHELLFDQMRSVVVEDRRTDGGGLVENMEFLRFAHHWGFRPRACRPYRAKTKGKVERPIRYVRQSFFYGREFVSDDDLNARAQQWLATVANARVLKLGGRFVAVDIDPPLVGNLRTVTEAMETNGFKGMTRGRTGFRTLFIPKHYLIGTIG